MVSSSSAAPLAPTFLDWWFAPWNYLDGHALALADGMLAQRDGYRSWCARAGLAAEFPSRFDAAWHIAALQRSQELRRCAALFGGLFAARTHSQASLAQLPREQQRWCMSVAMAQPLASAGVVLGPDAGAEEQGLAELALRLERRFPGMWSRLALLLPTHLALALGQSVRQVLAAGAVESDAANLRAQRCWKICLERVRAGAA